MLSYEIHARTFHFKQPAGTSRGVYTVRKSYFVTLHDSERPQCKGIGECAPLPRLSCDDVVNYVDAILRIAGADTSPAARVVATLSQHAVWP